ncbi:MAG TPA: hypothetical protein VM240_05530 [Verrucomicrobiae bacterium]|nr:hypothetical protein [Verrucomicrobiae bacterium]
MGGDKRREDSGFATRYASQATGWQVIRLCDQLVVKGGFSDEVAAQRWLEQKLRDPLSDVSGPPVRVKQTAENGIGHGTPGPGRPKGSLNKVTRSAKQAFQTVFDELDGTAGFLAWALASEGNLSDFYRLYARLIPHEHTGVDGVPLAPQYTPREIARRIAFALTLGLQDKEPDQ